MKVTPYYIICTDTTKVRNTIYIGVQERIKNHPVYRSDNIVEQGILTQSKFHKLVRLPLWDTDVSYVVKYTDYYITNDRDFSVMVGWDDLILNYTNGMKIVSHDAFASFVFIDRDLILDSEDMSDWVICVPIQVWEGNRDHILSL